MFKATRKDRAASQKRKVLRALIDREGETCTNAIIFCNRKTDVDITAKSLKKYGYNAAAIHGDLDQSKRMEVLDGFRAGTLNFLCASDVAARGLDIPNVSHVFNYDVPGHAEDYVHRIGRTGRAGREGKAIMICEPRDEKNLDAVERLIEKEIPRIDNPVPPEVRKSRSRKSTEDTATPEQRREEKPAKPDSAPKQAERRDDRQGDQRNDQRGDQRGEQRDRRNDRSGERNSGRGRGGQNRRDNRVVGMGDHLPDFIAKSFDERRQG